MIAATMANLPRGNPNQSIDGVAKPITQPAAAKMMNVSVPSITRGSDDDQPEVDPHDGTRQDQRQPEVDPLASTSIRRSRAPSTRPAVSDQPEVDPLASTRHRRSRGTA